MSINECTTTGAKDHCYCKFATTRQQNLPAVLLLFPEHGKHMFELNVFTIPHFLLQVVLRGCK